MSASDIARLTPLERSLEEIGFGAYQKKLVVLCGFGWLADNMWLQAVAVVLPRVQEDFEVSDKAIGFLSASTFLGMMVGASAWGAFSDVKGRVPAFNLTLLVTSIFGVLSAFAPSFPLLCLVFAGLGLGVGGAMPTDSTLFLENLPPSKHYMLTALSVFFSIGAVITSLLGLVLIPRENGWRYLLGVLAVITVAMMLSRIAFFKLLESPKWIVTTGDHEGAATILSEISRINDAPQREWDIADVQDAPTPPPDGEDTGEGFACGNGHAAPSTSSRKLARLAWLEEKLPPHAAQSYEDLMTRLDQLFSDHWRRTTILVWLIWTLASAAYTMFNVFLPKSLELKGSKEQGLRDYVFYTVAGMPGSIVAAYLVDTRWGRKGTMAVSTLLTALMTFMFAFVSSQSAVILSSVIISFMATTMYAVIYAYTPEVFDEPSLRGTACGIAAALSRLAGVFTPPFTGVLIAISPTLSAVVSAAFFVVTAICMALLPVETRQAAFPSG